MTRFKIFSAAAILSMMIATPVFAQAAIQEPGAFAFFLSVTGLTPLVFAEIAGMIETAGLQIGAR